MNIQTWKCDCKHSTKSMGVKKCKTCGKEQVICGVLDKPKRKVKERIKHHAPIDYTKIKDEHIGTEEKIAVSTMKMKGER